MEEKSSHDVQLAVHSKNEHDSQVLARLGKKSVLKVLDMLFCPYKIMALTEFDISAGLDTSRCLVSLVLYWSPGKAL